MIAFLTLNHAGLVFMQRLPFGTSALPILLVSCSVLARSQGHGLAWFGRVDKSAIADRMASGGH